MLDHRFLTTIILELVPVQWLEFQVFVIATAQKSVRSLCLKCAKIKLCLARA